MAMLRRRSDLQTSAWEEDGKAGLAVYDPRNDDGYVLDSAQAAVFEACDGNTSREKLAERVAARTGLPVDLDVVEAAIEELSASGLIAPTPLESVPAEPTVDKPTGVSRRVLLGRLAVGAGAAALLPAIDMVGGVSRLAAAPENDTAATTPPLVAQNKTTTTPQGTPVDVTLSTTGGFDWADPGSTAFQVQTDPAHGTVSLVGAVATYTPAADFVGTDTFTYIAWQCLAIPDFVLGCPDGTAPFPETGTAPATVTITVKARETTTTANVAPTTTEAKPAVQSTATPRFTG